MHIYTFIADKLIIYWHSDMPVKVLLNEVRNNIDKKDLNLFEFIFKGVNDNLILLEEILKYYSKIPIKKYRDKDKAYLIIAIFLILFSKNKDFAIVNEIVNCIKKEKYHLRGVANGILRNIVRNKDNIYDIVLNKKTKIERLSIKYSFSEDTTKRLLDSFTFDELEKLYISSKKMPRTDIIAINISREKLMLNLKELGYECEELKYSPNGISIKYINKPLNQIDLYKNGYFYIQSQMSQIVSYIIPKAKRSIDLCASPGGKSISLYSYQNNIELNLCDINQKRISIIDENLKRLNIKANSFINDASIINKNLIDSFDCVIIDAPCTGLGVIHRNTSSSYKKDISFLESLTKLQYKILETSKEYVVKGGYLIYSTCSIMNEENEDIVEDFLNSNKDFRLIDIDIDKEIKEGKYIKTSPIKSNEDGFFVALMKREDI